MTLSIVIPEDSEFLGNHVFSGSEGSSMPGSASKLASPRDVDGESLHWSLVKCPQRPILFYEETFAGFIVHTSPLEDHLPPQTVILSQIPTYDRHSDVSNQRDSAQSALSIRQTPSTTNKDQSLQTLKAPKYSRSFKNPQNAQNLQNLQNPQNPQTSHFPQKKETMLEVTDLIWQGQSRAMSDPPVNVSIWKFTSSTGCPQRETSGQIRFSATLKNADAVVDDQPESAKEAETKPSASPSASSPASEKPDLDLAERHSGNLDGFQDLRVENLLEELNHGVRGPPSRKYQLLYTENKAILADKKAAANDQMQKGQIEDGATASKGPENATSDPRKNGSNKTTTVAGAESAFLVVATSAPLQLKLRTTRPGGRSDLLLTTLRIEAPDSLISHARLNKHEKYYFHILGLEAEFRGGEISQLGKLSFPCRCHLNDVVNVTYKLVNDKHENAGNGLEQLTGPTAAGPRPPSSKPISIKVRVQIEKKSLDINDSGANASDPEKVTSKDTDKHVSKDSDKRVSKDTEKHVSRDSDDEGSQHLPDLKSIKLEDSGSDFKLSSTQEFVRTTCEITTTWTPILEFENGVQPLGPPPMRMPTPSGHSQSQFRSKSMHMKPPQSGLLHVKKTGATKSYASSSALPNFHPNSPYSPRPGWPSGTSPNLMRPMTPNKSSPLLSMSRGGATRKKTQRHVISHNGSAHGITLNLSNDTSSMLSGLRLTFMGSSRVTMGHITTWRVQVVNQTNRVLKLTLMTVAVKKNSQSFNQPGVSNFATRSSSHHTLPGPEEKRPGSEGKKEPRYVIQNKLQLYEQYITNRPQEVGVVLLSNDVGLGTLEPNQVHEAEFQFIGLRQGIHSLAGLRVAESTTGEKIDIGKLLEICVV